jgi:hypothetical protein
MDQQFNYSIRPPDKVKREKLIDDSSEYSLDKSLEVSFDYLYENELNDTINLSLKEFEKQEEMNKKYQEDIVNSFIVKVKERKDKFTDLLFKLKKKLLMF